MLKNYNNKGFFPTLFDWNLPLTYPVILAKTAIGVREKSRKMIDRQRLSLYNPAVFA
jgi:hypothetical protein